MKTVYFTIVASILLKTASSKFAGSRSRGRRVRVFTDRDWQIIQTNPIQRSAKILGVSTGKIRYEIAKKQDISLDDIPKLESGRRRRVFSDYEWDIIRSNTIQKSAEILGVSITKITSELAGKQGVHPKPRESRSHQWSKEDISLLGTMFDSDLAQTLNMKYGYHPAETKSLTSVNVFNKRNEFDPPIPSHKMPEKPGVVWTQEQIALIGGATDREATRRINSMRSDRGLNYQDYIRSADVSKKRKSLGRPMYRKPDHVWTQDEIELLWEYDDKTVASMIGGIAISKVGVKRKSSGIPTIAKIRRDHLLASSQKEIDFIEQSLNPQIRQGESFRTRDTQLLKRRKI